MKRPFAFVLSIFLLGIVLFAIIACSKMAEERKPAEVLTTDRTPSAASTPPAAPAPAAAPTTSVTTVAPAVPAIPAEKKVKTDTQAKRSARPTKGKGAAFEESIATAPALYWNVWSEDAGAGRFRSVTSLKPNTTYRLALDLSALKYNAPGAYPMPVGSIFVNKVDKWLMPGMPPPSLRVLLLADPGRFALIGPRLKDLPVNIEKLRKVWQNGFIETGDEFRILREAYEAGKEEPNFKFAGLFFEVRTANAEGPAAAAFSIWDQERPLDEVSVQFCIAGSTEVEKKECGNIQDTAFRQGVLSVRESSEGGEYPKAAIQFVALSENTPVTGVFRSSIWEKDKFLVWQLNETAKVFRQNLSEQHLKDIAEAKTDDNLLDRGESFFSHLFPVKAINLADGKSRVREEILKFIRPYIDRDILAEGYIPPSIFVRMIQVSPSPSLPIPLGLLAVRMDESKEMNQENGRFLGKYFLIESPLEIQTYKQPDKCLSRWVMVLPPEDTGDEAINAAMDHWGSKIEQWSNKEALTFNSMKEFKTWVNRAQSHAKEEPPITLITLSHHDNNSLYFYQSQSPKDNPLRPDSINRTFAQTSVAIINGCGTGGEGAVQFIRRLNEQGFSTIIAASTEIDGPIAGTFLKVLAAEISQSDPTQRMDIGFVYWRTVQLLSQLKPTGVTDGKPLYGAKALKFSLLGNRRVLLCAPNRENRPSKTE